MLFSWQIEAVKLIQKAWRKHRRTRRVIIFSHNILYFSYFICSPCSTSTFLITKTQKIDCKGREFFVFEKITSAYLFQIGQEKKEMILLLKNDKRELRSSWIIYTIKLHHYISTAFLVTDQSNQINTASLERLPNWTKGNNF